MSKGVFVISLDFELHWGVLDKVDVYKNEDYFQNTLEVIPTILNEFKENEIHCTWATVGMLFLKDYEEWADKIPAIIPQYKNKKLSPYLWGEKNKELLHNSKYHFSPNMVELINDVEGQEVSSHTFSHYYCLEAGQTLESFKNDLVKFNDVAKKLGIKVDSLVFPRNQFNPTYLNACDEMGIKIVRTNPKYWFWSVTGSKSLLKKIFRTLDCYIALSKNSFKASQVSKFNDSISLFPASRFLKPVSNNRILNFLRLNRIKKEMTVAAKKNEFYHLWWHPHNYGNNPKDSIRDLKEILQHYRSLNRKYGMESLNMSETHYKFFDVK